MPNGRMEHVNISVTDPQRSALMFETLCGWHVRWEGSAMNGGYTIHVGNEDSYLAVYCHSETRGGFIKSQPLNHVGLLVDDLDAAERIVVEHGLKPFNHANYEPGRRFYFLDWDGIEFEVVSYE